MKKQSASVPPWSYNPSAWPERIPICIIAGLGVAISTYLALFQWGIIESVWDPVFGNQSSLVIGSDVSHLMYKYFGIPDAAFGAYAYLGDAVFGIAGGIDRWYRRPWLVILFGLDVIPLGIVSIILVLIQGFVLQTWCFLCLITAIISLILIMMAYDEVWSSLIFIKYVRKKHKPYFWKCVWGQEVPNSILENYLLQARNK